MILTRRKLFALGGASALGLIAAPAIVRASSLMAIKAIPPESVRIFTHGGGHMAYGTKELADILSELPLGNFVIDGNIRLVTVRTRFLMPGEYGVGVRDEAERAMAEAEPSHG